MEKEPGDAERIGSILHLFSACVYLFLLPLATNPKDIAFAVLIACAAFRLPWTIGQFRGLLRDRLGWVLAGWAIWTAISILWSSDPAQAFDEFKAMRVLITPLLLWPVISATPLLIASMLAGVLAQNCVQLLQAMEWLGLHPSDNDRLRGLIHPIKTATFCAVAMCWHLSAILCGGWRVRIPCLIGLAAAGLGLLGTGSRGPWIAAAIALPACLVVNAIRLPHSRRMALGLAVMGLCAAAGAWAIFGSAIQARITAAISDVQAVLDNRTVATSAGLRWASWGWAARVFLDHPVGGTGAGGYQNAVRALPEFQSAIEREPQRRGYIDRSHPHSTYFYTLACTGLVGGMFLAAALAIVGARSRRDRMDHPFAAASFFVFLVWVIGALFESYSLNGHDLGLLMAMVAFVAPLRSGIASAQGKSRVELAARVNPQVNGNPMPGSSQRRSAAP